MPMNTPWRRVSPWLLGAILLAGPGTAGAAAPGPEAKGMPAGVAVGAALRPLIERDWIDRDRVEGPSGAAGSFSLATTRDVVARARRLADRLRTASDPARLAPLEAELTRLESRVTQAGTAPPPTTADRRTLYLEAHWLGRGVAFCNPLLEIDQLLFVKRHDARGVFHMCDQFYGCNAVPGGGLFVLHDPFGPEPRLQDLLKDAVVARGRLAGQRLEGGSFLAPDVSFDGTTIAFAYTQAEAFARTGGKEAYLWGPGISFHLFKVKADGTGLEQLSDGDPDDFDPCFLPDGHLAFISERRGGFLRCGRHCPVYTLFAMHPDGTDVTCLSFHETHEWQPSVTNDGRIVYTRWDYVDRDTNIAHHIWTCFPDGRDPRTFHGNYPERRESRPWMEMDIRAVPGSSRFVATAAAHHGHAFGSLVLIDPDRPDDGSMAQLTRLTPEVPFPEAEAKDIAKDMVYATAWPLSATDYLCAYDPAAKNHGIYWIDRDGNKELVYRDPSIASISPMPLAPRTRPPVIPPQAVASGGAAADRPATVAVMNVYNSDFAWPAGTKVAALRVVQLLPKSTAPPNEPRIGAAQQTNARAVLGTVPVEPDGSAFFEAPAGKPIYFQALDPRGLAVQSMRSVTYLHQGERLSCQGCHEPKQAAPRAAAALPIALRRAPSVIRPDGDGSNPFSYVRLVQPVLDHQCVDCHRKRRALDLTGVVEGTLGWTRSYTNLAGKYGFFFDVNNGSINTGVHGGSRTTPGRFGAAAAPLARYLDARHHGVRLAPEESHRIALWLDCNSEFYGSYENTAAQSRGAVVRPTLE
jgi:hypothetical protein